MEQGPGDVAERVVVTNAQGSVLLLDRQTLRPWFPAAWISIEMLAYTYDWVNHRSRAADLSADVSDGPVLRAQSESA
jgi:hypothetical protein